MFFQLSFGLFGEPRPGRSENGIASRYGRITLAIRSSAPPPINWAGSEQRINLLLPLRIRLGPVSTGEFRRCLPRERRVGSPQKANKCGLYVSLNGV